MRIAPGTLNGRAADKHGSVGRPVNQAGILNNPVPPPATHFFSSFCMTQYPTKTNCLSAGSPLRLCDRLPELNLIPIQVIDPGKAAVGFIHSFVVNLYSLFF